MTCDVAPPKLSSPGLTRRSSHRPARCLAHGCAGRSSGRQPEERPAHDNVGRASPLIVQPRSPNRTALGSTRAYTGKARVGSSVDCRLEARQRPRESSESVHAPAMTRHTPGSSPAMTVFGGATSQVRQRPIFTAPKPNSTGSSQSMTKQRYVPVLVGGLTDPMKSRPMGRRVFSVMLRLDRSIQTGPPGRARR